MLALLLTGILLYVIFNLGVFMPKSDVIIHNSEGLKVTLQTWRALGDKLFEFEAEGVILRVRFTKGVLSVIFNKGQIEIPNSDSNPVAVVLSKRKRRQKQ